MPERRIVSHRGKLPPDKLARLRASKQWVREHKQEIDQAAQASREELKTLIEAVRTLKAAREAKGLSLADVARRSGIHKANLSKLENDTNPNPTWSTLMRVAEAIGVTLRLQVTDRHAA